jgi:hypothetical protein
MHDIQLAGEAKGYVARSYSGRGMMGRECLAFTPTSMGEFLGDIVSYVYEGNVKTISEALRCIRVDNLGRDLVVYFPGIEYDFGEVSEDE